MIVRDTLVVRTLLAIARQRQGYDELRSQAMLEMLAAADFIRRRVRRQLTELSLSELQFAVLVVTLALDPEPISLPTLAAHTYSSRTTLIGVIDQLEERGLVVRDARSADRATDLLTITDAGRTLTETAQANVLRTINRSGEVLEASDPATLLALCNRLLDHADAAGC